MVLVAAATAGYTFIFKLVVDTISGLSEISSVDTRVSMFVTKVVPLIIGVTLISGASLFAQVVLSNSVALNVIGDLQKAMFKSLQRVDFSRFQVEPVGNLVSHFTNDVTRVSEALLRTLNNLIRDVLKVIFLVGAMIYYDWQTAALLLLVYPLAIFPIIKISKMVRGTSHEAMEQMGIVTSQLTESLGGARMTRTYGLEDKEMSRLGVTFDERIRLYLKLVTSKARVDPILEVLGGLAIAGVLAFGVWRVSQSGTTWGDLVGLLGAIGLIGQPVRAIGTLNNVAQEGLAAVDRIFKVIDETPTVVDAPNAKPLKGPLGAVTFDNVRFLYPDGTEALKGMSFAAKPGETIALVGASGGGKSTVINLIPRLYDVSAGSISIDGTDIRKVTLESLRSNMALVSQHVTLFDDTIANNIGFGDSTATREDIIAAAKSADAHGFIMRLPKGYDSIVGEDGDTLSGGQRQRIAIARAILRDAPILLLDEATSALDAESESKVQTALETLSNGRTTIVIAHRLSTVQNADKIFVLDKGAVVESGTHKTLSKKKGGVYAKLRDLQT